MFRLEAIVTGGGGSHLVSGRPDGTGGYRVAFHPSIPGGYDVRLVGRWQDGRELACPLPHLEVVGDHPCRDGIALDAVGPCPITRSLLAVPAGTAGRIEGTVLVPDGAPADLSMAAFAVDRQDLWFASQRPQRLVPGINRFSLPVGAGSGLASVPGGCAFTASTLATLRRCGVAFSTASTAPAGLVCSPLTFRRDDGTAAASPPRLLDLGIRAGSVATGERWTASLLPDPFPQNPFDPDSFRVDLLVTCPDGSARTIPGFYGEDMDSSDRGDREAIVRRDGRFHLRFRPPAPGRYRLAVQALWQGRRSVRCELPPLDVSGAPWDGIVHVDRQDGRFFTADGRFFWPFGPNLRSVWDARSRDHMGTRLTPDRGSLAYRSYLRRFAAAGANACEIWMSAWNLALEWRADWPGYDGIGRFNMANAWRLDRILDEAWSQGMRVNLVINNHGQASDRCDAEWQNNPYNRSLGGPLFAPAQVFSDRAALLGQDRLRRYVVGRYADHPAVLAWKLWTEIDLTNGGPALESWHAAAARRWRELDAYGHPVATHWCSDYTHPTPEIVRLVDVVCIDAYHEDDPRKPYALVNRLLRDSTVLPGRGLGRLGKPVLVTEYGGSPVGTRTDALMAVDHAVGAWTAFVSGHAGGPMLWWFEWIDQGGRFAPYGAIRRFIADEDLRGDGRAVDVRAETAAIWAGAWRTRSRLYGYALDERWARDGLGAASIGAKLNCGDGWPAGGMTCEWWDPDIGRVMDIQRLQHPGGAVRLSAPAFKRHIAWKLRW